MELCQAIHRKSQYTRVLAHNIIQEIELQTYLIYSNKSITKT